MHDTLWMLQGRYEFKPIIPAETVAQDFFDLQERAFLRKIDSGDIALPIVKLESSQKAAKGVHVKDLAEYIDQCAATARRERDRIFY